MRKHDPRKWLHAILDLLPVIIIPVFMIYSHRHTIDNYSVVRAENQIVNFNQLNSIEPSTYTISGYVDGANWTNPLVYYTNHNYDFSDRVGHVFIGRSNITENGLTLKLVRNDTNVLSRFVLNSGSLIDDTYFDTAFARLNTSVDFTGSLQVTFNLFDLTQMFGEGNEPSLVDFNVYFPEEYYNYTLQKQVLVPNVEVTYNDTDIGSQLLYSMYNPINKYFNMKDVANFQDVYDWMELNIFKGNAPLSVDMVFNIILYEFIMDVIFLLYAVFMFVIDFVENLMDSFFYKAHHGGA